VAQVKEVDWLIIGSGGQLSLAMQEALLQSNIEYQVLGSSVIDIRSSINATEISKSIKARNIINASAWTDVEGAETKPNEAMSLNVIGSVNAARMAKYMGARLFHISSDYVFDGSRNVPYLESDMVNPMSVYGRTKAQADHDVSEFYGERTYIIRTAWLYSPWAKNFYKTILGLALKSDSEIKVVNDQFGQPTSCLDLARSIIEISESRAEPGIYNRTNSGTTSWYGFAKLIFEIAGKGTERVIPVSSEEFPSRVIRPKYSVLDSQKAEQNGLGVLDDWENSVRGLYARINLEVLKA
jgi:dTDP-4-dehydrorhamnose reductase